jgi:hypothetical protein
MVAGAHRTSRSYVLASLRALHLDLRLVASDQAAAEERPIPGRQLTTSARWGHFKPASDISGFWWGHFKPSRWVHLEASQPAPACPVRTTLIAQRPAGWRVWPAVTRRPGATWCGISARMPPMGERSVKGRGGLARWPGCGRRAWVDCFLAFLAGAGFVPPRGRGSSWSARSVSARQGAGEDERA